jgi:FKBP-type peptidyl-prolyl cis-trans isomerase
VFRVLLSAYGKYLILTHGDVKEMRQFLPGLFIAVSFAVAGCTQTREYPGEKSLNSEEVQPDGLRFIELRPGEGTAATEGMVVSVHYTGYLMDGKKFDSSHDRKEPITFVLGAGQVIKGWEEGLLAMKVGQKRKLIIPSHLAYGDRGIPGLIPPGSELVFDVELVGARERE